MDIKELQFRKFDFLNKFHFERTESILEDLADEYGEEIIHIADKQSINLYDLYRWHTVRYVDFLENLKLNFGEEIIRKIIANEMKKEEMRGKELFESGSGEFDLLVNHFTGGCAERVIEENEHFVIIKTGQCFAGKIGYDLGKSEMLYPHHCGLDQAFVKGFNSECKIEIQKSILCGDAYCLHKIWK